MKPRNRLKNVFFQYCMKVCYKQIFLEIQLIINFDMISKRIFVLLCIVLVAYSSTVEIEEQETYYDFQFIQCGKGCLNCTQTQCQVCDEKDHWEIDKGKKDCKCMTSYYEDKMKCLACSQGCLVCDGATGCKTCDQKNHYTIKNNTCQCLPTFASINHKCVCQDGKYVDENKCSDCVSPCATCLNKDLCKSCIQGYDLNGQKCEQSGGLPLYVIILIAVGGLVVVGAIGGAVVYFLKKKKSSSPLQEQGQYQPLS